MLSNLSVWGKIIAGVVTLLNILATAMVTKRAKLDGRNEAELEAIKDANAISVDIALARESLPLGPEAWRDDPDNERDTSNPLP